MAIQPSPPDLKESSELLDDLFADVKKWEGTLAGGTQLDVGAAAVDSLRQTQVSFGNPRTDLVALTPELFEELGVELNAVQKRLMQDRFDFYYVTVNVNMRSKPGALFKSLYCELDFGPKGPDEPIVHALFPQSEWRPVMNWGGGMSLGLNGDLTWSAGLDATGPISVPGMPAELKANVANKHDLKAFITIPDYAYQVGRFDIAASGEGGATCYWHIQDPDLQKILTVQFAIVFKVPKGVKSFTLHGTAWTEPNMNWLIANVRDVFSDLKVRLQSLLRRKGDAADKFAQGAAETWTLDLPKGRRD